MSLAQSGNSVFQPRLPTTLTAMHWLQSLDAALFHFINGTLANPFFDWLMPVLSGHGVPWLVAVVIAVPRDSGFWLRAAADLRAAHGARRRAGRSARRRHHQGRRRPPASVCHPARRAALWRNRQRLSSRPCPTARCPPTRTATACPPPTPPTGLRWPWSLFLFYRRSAWFMFPLAAARGVFPRL